MKNRNADISEVRGYGILYPGRPGFGQIVGIEGGSGQFIGQFPINSSTSTGRVGKRTDNLVLAKPDSERWWSTTPYVPPLH